MRRWILSYAILAPHSHNLQSWLVDLRQPNEITLYCDLSRLLPRNRSLVAPDHDEPWHLPGTARPGGAAQGPARRHRAVSARASSARTKLDTRPVARIRLAPDASVKRGPAVRRRFCRRRTNREAYEPREPAAAALRAIADSVAPHAFRVGFVGAAQPDALQQHRAIAMDAWRIELVTPRTIMESYKVLRVGPREIAQHRDGLSINTPMVRALTALGLFDRSKPPGPDDAATTGADQGLQRQDRGHAGVLLDGDRRQ